jgi:hypothetical protein
MAFDAAHNQVVLFGGNPDGSNALSDTWTWDGNNWTEVSQLDATGTLECSHVI